MTRLACCAITALWLLASGDVARADSPTSAYHVVKKIPLGGDGGWDYLTVDGDGRRLYIARSNRVMVVDADKGTLVGEIADTPGVHGIAVARKHNRGFSSNGRDATVTVFDLETLKPLARVKVGRGPDAIIYDSATDRVFTFNAGSRDTTAIDAGKAEVVGTIPLGGKPEFAAADGKGRIFVNLEDKSEIAALDSRDLKLLNRWKLEPGKAPSGLAIDREHNRLFSTCHNQKMVVLDADSGKVIGTAPIGRGTDAAAFDPDTGLAFSSNGDGTLTVVKGDDAGQFQVLADVKTEMGARTMAIDPKTHNIFLVTASPKPTPGGQRGQRPVFDPKSFTLLVVGK
jgi:DNA-binding beta-propeller fold protein YncE